MEIHLAGKHLVAEVTTALDVAGREHLVIVVKTSWSIPQVGQRPRPMAPSPLVRADEFHGEPGQSALRYEGDFARFKPRCDVLFDAHAHAPGGQAVRELQVSIAVGPLRKTVQVLGRRHWFKTMGLVTLSPTEPFTSMPLHYGMAFGGTRTYQPGLGSDAPVLTESLRANPAGLGWVGPKTSADVDLMPAPCLMAEGDSIRTPGGKHAPVALSAVARHWEPRTQYVGTYDERWARDVAPFLPEDFDEQFHQCAPQDQQMPYPQGGEEVVLTHMMPDRPVVRFKLPRLNDLQIRVLYKNYRTANPQAVVDTLYFEPECQRFSAVWRASVPIQRRIQEFDTIAIGSIDMAWWRNKSLGLDGSGCVGCGRDQKVAA